MWGWDLSPRAGVGDTGLSRGETHPTAGTRTLCPEHGWKQGQLCHAFQRISVCFSLPSFFKAGSQGTGRAWFNPRAAAQPGTAALHRGQGRAGGAGEGLSALLGEKSLPGETQRGWDEGGTVTLGGGMEPQLCQSGTPTQSGAEERANPNSLRPSRTSQDVPPLLHPAPGPHSAPLQGQGAEKPPRMQGLC